MLRGGGEDREGSGGTGSGCDGGVREVMHDAKKAIEGRNEAVVKICIRVDGVYGGGGEGGDGSRA